MVTQAQIIVKLADEQQAVVDWGGIEVRDARAYTPQTVTVMNLEDAIAVAKAVLRFVGEEYADEILAEARADEEDDDILWDDGATPDEVGELDWEAYAVWREQQLELAADARADATSAEWGWD